MESYGILKSPMESYGTPARVREYRMGMGSAGSPTAWLTEGAGAEAAAAAGEREQEQAATRHHTTHDLGSI